MCLCSILNHDLLFYLYYPIYFWLFFYTSVINQMKLSDVDVFNLLVRTLSDYQNVILQSSAVFLAINLMYNNSKYMYMYIRYYVDFIQCRNTVYTCSCRFIRIIVACTVHVHSAMCAISEA